MWRCVALVARCRGHQQKTNPFGGHWGERGSRQSWGQVWAPRGCPSPSTAPPSRGGEEQGGWRGRIDPVRVPALPWMTREGDMGTQRHRAGLPAKCRGGTACIPPKNCLAGFRKALGPPFPFCPMPSLLQTWGANIVLSRAWGHGAGVQEGMRHPAATPAPCGHPMGRSLRGRMQPEHLPHRPGKIISSGSVCLLLLLLILS